MAFFTAPRVISTLGTSFYRAYTCKCGESIDVYEKGLSFYAKVKNKYVGECPNCGFSLSSRNWLMRLEDG